MQDALLHNILLFPAALVFLFFFFSLSGDQSSGAGVSGDAALAM